MQMLDRKALRNAFGSFMTGVTVVTSRTGDGTPIGFTANSFTSVSLDPPLVLVCPGNHLSSFRAFIDCNYFAVNVLAERQEAISNIFAGSKADRFSMVDWHEDRFGSAIIDETAASFSCKVHECIEAGDHVILVGEVLAFECAGKRGLGYYSGGYFNLGYERQSEASAEPGTNVTAGAIIEHGGCILASRHAGVMHLPEVSLRGHNGARSGLVEFLEIAGLAVDVGRVYSVFDSASTGEHFIFFRAKSHSAEIPPAFEEIPIEGIAAESWSAPAQGRMLTRFANEYRTNVFGLYVGDSNAGEVHSDGAQ